MFQKASAMEALCIVAISCAGDWCGVKQLRRESSEWSRANRARLGQRGSIDFGQACPGGGAANPAGTHHIALQGPGHE